MNTRVQLDDVLDQKWFHAIRFDEHRTTNGRFPKSRPANYTLFGALEYLRHIDVRGMDCVDLGTMDGLIAFALSSMHAGSVVATDMAPRKTFEAGRAFLGHDIDYRHPVTIDSLGSELAGKKVDLLVCCGILYHVFEPLMSLVQCRERLRTNGLMILETQYAYAESAPVIAYSPADRVGGSVHANTFFRPSFTALVAMVETAGFEVVSTISTNARITLLARAARPSEIQASTPMVEKILRTYMSYANYGERVNYEALQACQDVSGISHSVRPRSHVWLDSSTYRSACPYQPWWAPSLEHLAARFAVDQRYRVQTMVARRTTLPSLQQRPLGRR